MLSGVGRQAYNARRLSKIAAESVPTKDRRYSFEKTNNDGEKVTQYLDEDDVKALTNAKGQGEIDNVIDQIGIKYGLSDSERANLKIGGPSKMGFVHKKYPIIKNAVKEAPIQKENVRYYRLHPNKRVEALASRSAEDLAKTVTSTKRTNQGIRAATQFEINKNQSEKPYELPDGYVIDNGKH
jgi:hypothetical protein